MEECGSRIKIGSALSLSKGCRCRRRRRKEGREEEHARASPSAELIAFHLHCSDFWSPSLQHASKLQRRAADIPVLMANICISSRCMTDNHASITGIDTVLRVFGAPLCNQTRARPNCRTKRGVSRKRQHFDMLQFQPKTPFATITSHEVPML